MWGVRVPGPRLGKPMKRKCLCWGGLIVLAACGSDVTPSEPPKTEPPKTEPPAGPIVGSVAIDQLNGFLGRILFDVRDQTTLTATVKDASGAVLAGRQITWTSSAPGVAAVDSSGLVTGMAGGDATITATTGGKSDSRDVRVIPLNLTTFQLTLLVTDTAGTPLPDVKVFEEYYGARPSSCLSCNIPWGNFV